MRVLIAITLACFLGACAHMHIVCQDSGMTSMAVGGNTAGQQILTLGLSVAGAAAKGGGLMAMASPRDTRDIPPTPQAQSYVDYTYLPIFGSDFASCNTAPPTPGVSVMFLSPNGGPPQIVTSDAHQVVVAPSQK